MNEHCNISHMLSPEKTDAMSFTCLIYMEKTDIMTLTCLKAMETCGRKACMQCFLNVTDSFRNGETQVQSFEGYCKIARHQ